MTDFPCGMSKTTQKRLKRLKQAEMKPGGNKMLDANTRKVVQKARDWFSNFSYNWHGVADREEFADHAQVLQELEDVLKLADLEKIKEQADGNRKS